MVLAKARNIPSRKPKPKKAKRTKGPAPGKGCGTDKMLLAGDGDDIEITTQCHVGPGIYNYRYVNTHSGGKLIFDDEIIDFWAKSILVENEGSLLVGTPTDPIGNTNPNSVVTFHLYGDDNQIAGITCKTTDGSRHCGVADDNWTSFGREINLPSGISDYFYAYQRLPADDNRPGGLTTDSSFGLKTLAVSFGGTLQMFGANGASYRDANV